MLFFLHNLENILPRAEVAAVFIIELYLFFLITSTIEATVKGLT